MSVTIDRANDIKYKDQKRLLLKGATDAIIKDCK